MTPNHMRAVQYALRRLEKELNKNLVYHGIGHTRDEVVPAVARLSHMENLAQDEADLLLTAAWFHDLGFIEQSLHHELISARISAEQLPRFGFSTEQVEKVRWAILATALPQSPQTLFEQILTDADLDVLGRDDFLSRNADLRRELALAGKLYDDHEWFMGQLKFIESHEYFTASAHALRDDGKLKNMAELKQILQRFEK